MSTVTTLAALCALVALATAANAAQIASPSIVGSHEQDRAECTAFHGGTGNLTVTIRILTEAGAIHGARNCGVVGPDQMCSLSLPIANGVAYACVAIAGSIANLRGVLVIQQQVLDSFGGTYTSGIRSAPLR